MIKHFKYWNKWRKKFPTAYSKWYKFLVLIGLKRPYTLRMMIFADTYRGALVALNNLTEVLNKKAPEKKNLEQDHKGTSATTTFVDEMEDTSNEVSKV